ncbi:hypothetical protein [Streptomyces alboniger]
MPAGVSLCSWRSAAEEVGAVAGALPTEQPAKARTARALKWRTVVVGKRM